MGHFSGSALWSTNRLYPVLWLALCQTCPWWLSQGTGISKNLGSSAATKAVLLTVASPSLSFRCKASTFLHDTLSPVNVNCCCSCIFTNVFSWSLTVPRLHVLFSMIPSCLQSQYHLEDYYTWMILACLEQQSVLCVNSEILLPRVFHLSDMSLMLACFCFIFFPLIENRFCFYSHIMIMAPSSFPPPRSSVYGLHKDPYSSVSH